jgi:hypothetical protein
MLSNCGSAGNFDIEQGTARSTPSNISLSIFHWQTNIVRGGRIEAVYLSAPL